MKHSAKQIIDTKDRSSGTSTSGIIDYNSNNNNERKLVLKKIIIPLSYDNISTNTNQFSIGGVSHTVPDGYYSISSLLTEMTTQAGAPYTFTLNSGNRVVVGNGGGAAFNFDPDELTNILGFTTTYTGANQYIGESFPDANHGKDYMTLHSKELANRARENTIHSDSRSNAVAIIPIFFDHGKRQLWEPEEIIDFDMTKRITFFDYELRFSDNTVVDLHGDNFQMVFDVYDLVL